MVCDTVGGQHSLVAFKPTCAFKTKPIYKLADTELTFSTGSFQYSHAVGKTSVDKTDTSDAKDIQDDAVFLLASQTKLLTAFSAMLVVERGLIGFDDDVSELLPELGEQKVLRGFEDDGQGGERAILEEREGKLTLRYVFVC
jgi:CubicO group peptidase (beta-lactamase class C family)